MDRRTRRRKLLLQTAVWAAVLSGYYLFNRLTGLAIPCVFRKVTGLRCPGCGVSHMLIHMSKFRFREALTANPLLFFLVPLLILLLAVKIIFLPPQLEAGSRLLTLLMSVFIGLTLVFGVVRNIIGI